MERGKIIAILLIIIALGGFGLWKYTQKKEKDQTDQNNGKKRNDNRYHISDYKELRGRIQLPKSTLTSYQKGTKLSGRALEAQKYYVNSVSVERMRPTNRNIILEWQKYFKAQGYDVELTGLYDPATLLAKHYLFMGNNGNVDIVEKQKQISDIKRFVGLEFDYQDYYPVKYNGIIKK